MKRRFVQHFLAKRRVDETAHFTLPVTLIKTNFRVRQVSRDRVGHYAVGD